MKTHLSEQPVVVHPPKNAEQNSNNSFRSRRNFISSAACAAGAIGLSPLLGSSGTKAEAATAFGQTRAVQALDIRRNAALAEFQVPPASHTNNGDEQRYSNKIGNYSKGLPHNSLGEVDLAAYNTYLNAIRSGQPSDFENIALGGTTRLTNPQAGLAFGLEGADSGNLSEPPSPAVASQERADEAVENYWMALLRDVPFTDYATDSMATQACSELSNLSAFTGPRMNGQVTPQTLFRGFTAGDVIGPYISQFLLQDVSFGALPLRQQYTTYLPGIDYMTDFSSWLAVQNGQGPFGPNPIDREQLRYLRNGRDVSSWVHVDLLYQAYFMAMLWLLRYAGSNAAGFNASNPYNSSRTQVGFGTFGAPHICALMTEVSAYALRAQWFQKWWVHRALRPEAYGGLVHNVKTGTAQYPLHADVLNSQAVATVFAKKGSYLLPMAFPEGSPTHPSYGSGHATVAGACVTALKAFFNTDNVVFPGPVVPAADGLATPQPYTGADAAQITLTGELNKLASNIAQARNIAGVHWRSDATQSMLLGEAVAISILRDQKRCYNESFGGFKFTKFDGTEITV
ncbi:MAG: phosphoesterase [Acidobacteria bacterium]|nr:MAG: phosphoesterase [Acidobacteriota bacterium]